MNQKLTAQFHDSSKKLIDTVYKVRIEDRPDYFPEPGQALNYYLKDAFVSDFIQQYYTIDGEDMNLFAENHTDVKDFFFTGPNYSIYAKCLGYKTPDSSDPTSTNTNITHSVTEGFTLPAEEMESLRALTIDEDDMNQYL